MKSNSITAKMLFAILFFFMANFSFAQYIVETENHSLTIDYESLGDEYQSDEYEKMDNKIMEMPLEKLLQLAPEEDREAEKIVFYIDGKSYAAESETEEAGKVKVIMDNSKNQFSIISYDQKAVTIITSDELKQMQQGMSEMAGYSNRTEEEVKSTMKSTGRTRNINGFNCEEYVFHDEEVSEITVIWASDDDKGVSKKIKELLNQFESVNSSPEEREKSEWEMIEGKIPVEVRKMQINTYQGNIDIQQITKIEEKNISKDKFHVPAESEGFTHNSMKEMIEQMMKQMQQNPDSDED